MAKKKKKQVQPEAAKDDGQLYKIVDANGCSIYPGTGVSLGEAERLARGLKTVGAVVPV